MGPLGMSLDLTPPRGGGNEIVAQIKTRRNQLGTRCWCRNQTSERSVLLLQLPNDVPLPPYPHPYSRGLGKTQGGGVGRRLATTHVALGTGVQTAE